ncbi:TPA: hypothetical protein ACX6MH_001472 [Photobacterium damselae]
MKKLILTCCTIFLSFHVCGAMLDGMVSNNEIKYHNLVNSLSGDGAKAIADWEPITQILPVKNWTPGFINNNKPIILTGPGGSVDITGGINVIGIEFKSYKDLVKSKEKPFSSVCQKSGFSGSISYVVDKLNKGICYSDSIFSGENHMPFYFIRPILDINNNMITDAFSKMENKAEGYYASAIPIVITYGYEQLNGIKTWRNLTKILSISIYYKAAELTSISLEDPSIHNMKISKLNTGMIKGSTRFNVIAKGSFNGALRLSLEKNNNYQLINSLNSLYNIDYSIKCPNCNRTLLVDNGLIQGDGTTKIIHSTSDELRFPIDVDFMKKNHEIRPGDYYGQFTIIFSPDI